MGLLLYFRKYISILIWIQILQIAKTQDRSKYVFGPTASTDYETSLSSSFQNNRGFIPSGLGSSSPYQEKFYYFGSNNGERGFQPSSRFQPSTRAPFELPQRPFNQPIPFNSFSRPFSTANTGPGFQPSRNQKSNVPHQQTEFLSHFNDQIQQQQSSDLHSLPKLSTQSTGGNLRFGNNRIRFRENNTPSSTQTTSSVATASPQQLPLRSFRSRFQSSSERLIFTTPTTSTTLTTDKPVVRFNRFGGRSNQPFNPRSTTTKATTIRPSPNVSISPPSPSKQLSFTKKAFTPKRPPFFTSRESNLPAYLFKPTSTTEEIIESKSQSTPVQNFKFSSTEKSLHDKKQEEHTVILTENFFLPGGGVLREDDLPPKTADIDDFVEYENDYDDESTYSPTTLESFGETKENHTQTTTDSDKSPQTTTAVGEDVVYEYVEEEYDDDSDEPVLTTEKPLFATTTKISRATSPTTIPKVYDSGKNETINQSTESYVVVASIQTSRSINGARFLPFPAIEQEEKKQTLSELEKKIHDQRNKKEKEDEATSIIPIVHSSTPTISTTTTIAEDEKPTRNSNILRSFKSGAPGQELIKENKILNKIKTDEKETIPSPTTTEKNLFGGLIFKEDEIDPALLPPGFKLTSRTTTTRTTTKKPTTITTTKPTESTTKKMGSFLFSEGNIDPSLLPADFHMKPTTSKEMLTPVFKPDLIDPALLPPDFKIEKDNITSTTTTTTTKKSLLFKEDEIDPALLPPGFKFKFGHDSQPTTSSSTSTTTQKPTSKSKSSLLFVEEIIDPSLLPPGFRNKAGFKSKKTEKENKIEEPSTTTSTSTTTTSTESSFKLVFPKGISPHRKPLQKKVESVSVSKPSDSKGGPPPPPITIRKGPPVRATTEFTGWPTTSTTPIPIDFEKLLEISRNSGISFGEQESSSSTTTTEAPTTHFVTSTEPPTTRKPGHCIDECDLAGTIRIVDGVKWRPELLDHNTVEWKNLAKEVESKLNEIYAGSGKLKKWYKKVRIDSFSKGSVLVDYFVELQNITRDVSTLEIKELFHESLTVIPKPVIPIANAENIISEAMNEHYMLGRFVVDPVATDFIVIPRKVSVSSEFDEDDVLLPQWATALIVVGVGSLFFVILFGVAVLINRQRRAKKTPTPLTADMLNELNKDHMGGVENYGVDDFYNLDDTWNDTKPPIKAKRFSNNSYNDSNSSYDSWRSVERQPPPPIPDYYHHGGKNFRQLQPVPNYRNHQYQQRLNPYMQQYDDFEDEPRQYSRSRYQRDYGPDF